MRGCTRNIHTGVIQHLQDSGHLGLRWLGNTRGGHQTARNLIGNLSRERRVISILLQTQSSGSKLIVVARDAVLSKERLPGVGWGSLGARGPYQKGSDNKRSANSEPPALSYSHETEVGRPVKPKPKLRKGDTKRDCVIRRFPLGKLHFKADFVLSPFQFS
jgi:hypothetical protein